METARGPIAIKRARAQLKVAQEWYAPVARNAYEVKWFRIAEAVAPGATPEVLGEDRSGGLFAMRYLDPAGIVDIYAEPGRFVEFESPRSNR